jgi:hypothetical protein
MKLQFNNCRVLSLTFFCLLCSWSPVYGQSCPKYPLAIAGRQMSPAEDTVETLHVRFSKVFDVADLVDDSIFIGYFCQWIYFPAFDVRDTLNNLPALTTSGIIRTDSTLRGNLCILRTWDFDDDYIDSPTTAWNKGVPAAICSWGIPADPADKSVAGTENPVFSTDIKMYPNPARSFVTIESDEPSTFVLSDASGKKIMELKVDGCNLIDISELATGIYTVINTRNAAMQRLLIE